MLFIEPNFYILSKVLEHISSCYVEAPVLHISLISLLIDYYIEFLLSGYSVSYSVLVAHVYIFVMGSRHVNPGVSWCDIWPFLC